MKKSKERINGIDAMKFENIPFNYARTRSRNNNTQEKNLEYDMYYALNNLLEVLEGFECENRDVMKTYDQDELISQIERSLFTIQNVREVLTGD